MLRSLVFAPALLLAACAHAPGAPLPPCLEVHSSVGPEHTQQFRFDAEGRLTEQTALGLSPPGGEPFARERYEWSAEGVRGRGEAAGNEGHFGPHGELLDYTQGKLRSTFQWEGRFAPAPPWPFFEGLYIGTAIDPLLPRFTAERGIFQRMQPFLFTGQVTVTRHDPRDPREGVRAVYRDGRLQTMESPTRRAVLTWSAEGALEREVETRVAPSEEGALEVTYETTAGHLRTSLIHVAGASYRSVTYTWGADGQLARVSSILGAGKESMHLTVDIRACADTAPRGPGG